MNHENKSAYAGQKVKIKEHVEHPQYEKFGGQDIIIEDWWDRVAGKSWMVCDGNPACLLFAMRTGFSSIPVPVDNEVLYGMTEDGLGHLVHISELELS